MNWKQISILAVVAIGVLMQACARKVKPEEPCHFVQNSIQQRVSWGQNLPVEMMVHESVPSQYYESIERAAEAWKHLMGREMIRIVQWNVGGSAIPEKDGYSMITMMDSWDTNQNREQARTSVYWKGHQILEADIRINDKDFDFSVSEVVESSKVDLTSLVLHEMGHVLGLAHIEEDTSVMQSELSKGEDRRDIGESGPEFWALSCEY